jgi:hypothetical protein
VTRSLQVSVLCAGGQGAGPCLAGAGALIAWGRGIWLRLGLVLALALACLAQEPVLAQRATGDSVQALTILVAATAPKAARPLVIAAPQPDPALPGAGMVLPRQRGAGRLVLPGVAGPQAARGGIGLHWPRAPPAWL